MRGEGLFVVALAEVGRAEVAVRAALPCQVGELLGHHQVLLEGCKLQWCQYSVTHQIEYKHLMMLS